MFSLWLLIAKLLALGDGLLSYFVSAEVQFNKMADGQWNLQTFSADLTDKGNLVLADVATIIHYGLDFLAQFMTMLPAESGVLYNGMTTW